MYRLLSDCAFSFSVSVTLTNVIDNLLIAMFRVRVVFEYLNGEYASDISLYNYVTSCNCCTSSRNINVTVIIKIIIYSVFT